MNPIFYNKTICVPPTVLRYILQFHMYSNELECCDQLQLLKEDNHIKKQQCTITCDWFIELHSNNYYLISSPWLCSHQSFFSLQKINHQMVDRAIIASMDTLINNKSTYWTYK